MLKYFGFRLLALLPKLLIITIVIFIGIQYIPGDAVTRSIPPEQYMKLSPVQLDELRTKLGLNDSVFLQYFRWVGNILKGDFGYSLVSGGSIAQIIGQRLPATLELAGCGLFIAMVFGLLLGFISALKKNTVIDYANTAFGMIGLSVPEFFLGLCMIVIFALNLKWFPTGGRIVIGKEALFDRLQFLVLPSISLGFTYIATLMRFTRGSMLDVLSKDYIRTARSKGLSEVKVNVKHGFRNALIPVMVVLIFRIPMLVGGTVVIENAFNYPGMGSMLVNAVNGSDMPLIMMTTLIIAFVILLSSFLLDVITALLDPRIAFGAGKEG